MCRIKRFASYCIPDAGRTAGFTLVELMLAVTISTIVMLAIGSLMIGETRNAARNRQVVSMHCDATLAMNVIGDHIRGAYLDVDEVHLWSSNNGNVTKLFFDSGEGDYVRCRKNQGEVSLKLKGSDHLYLINGEWEIRDFSVYAPDDSSDPDGTESTSWHVILELRVPGTTSTIALDSSVTPRNSIPGT